MAVRFLCDKCSYQIHLETPRPDGMPCPSCGCQLLPLAEASVSVMAAPPAPDPVQTQPTISASVPTSMPITQPSRPERPFLRPVAMASAVLGALAIIAASVAWTANSKHRPRPVVAANDPQSTLEILSEPPPEEQSPEEPPGVVVYGPFPEERGPQVRPVSEEEQQPKVPGEKPEPGSLQKIAALPAIQPRDATPEVKAKPPEKPLKPFKRRDKSTEEDLRKQLLLTPEIALDSVPNTSAQVKSMAAGFSSRGIQFQGPAMLLARRADLQGLPLRMGVDCQLGKEPAENMQVMSRKLRVALESTIPKGNLPGPDTRPDADKLRAVLLDQQQAEWLRPEAVPCLLQLLQAENSPVRKVLVEALGRIDDKRATEALAMRAMMDLNSAVRETAARLLLDRPREDYEPLLLAGLRYPWTPVATHAAETLAFVKDTAAVPQLVKMLDQPDATLPFTVRQGPRQTTMISEVVRVNHLANCMLCHPPSFATTDSVRGAVPTPGKALPAPATTPQYYDSGSVFVRADMTYLRQDFSVMQPVTAHGQWPEYQRFDYVVRLRPPTARETQFIAQQKLDKVLTESRESVLFALREISGKDLGATSKDWRTLIAPSIMAKGQVVPFAERVGADWRQFVGTTTTAEVDVSNEIDAARLKKELLAAPKDQQQKLLLQLSEAKGLPYTDALAEIAGQLQGPLQKQARDLLAERLARMTDTTLRDRLTEDDAELRLAAVRAVGLKKAKSLTPELLLLLSDKDAAVIQAARLSLKALTERDFGPPPDADGAAREKAAAEWKAWWKQQSGA